MPRKYNITKTNQKILKLIKQGYTNQQIIDLLGVNSVSISRLRKKYNLAPSPDRIKTDRDWDKIQAFYDEGHSINETSAHFSVGVGAIKHKIKTGGFKTRTAKATFLLFKKKYPEKLRRTLNNNAKTILREHRIKYMQKHPNETAWFRRNSHDMSYPEKKFKDALIENNITGWKYDYKNGIYKYDFGFPVKKIDVEIDGKWHDNEIMKQKDRMRDEYSISNGWRVIRFSAKDVLFNINECILKLKQCLLA